MPQLAIEPESGAMQGNSRYLIAVVTASILAIAGVAIAIQQFYLKYLWDQSAHTRTIGGVLFQLMGLFAVCLPLLLFYHQRRFRSLVASRQWLVIIGVPIVYVLLFAICVECSMRSTHLILARPFIPTAVVRFNPKEPIIKFQGGWRQSLEEAYDHNLLRDGKDEFSAHLYQGFLRHPSRETITIKGHSKLLNDGMGQIQVDVDAQEPVLFTVDNLADFSITRDGQPISLLEPLSGKFRLTIKGRPT